MLPDGNAIVVEFFLALLTEYLILNGFMLMLCTGIHIL